MKIPEKGLPREQLFARLEAFRAGDVDWRSGRTWAYVYDPGREAEEVVKHAFSTYLSENGLDPTAFPSALALENEIVAMAIAHLHGDARVVGTFTSGGTESIILAVKAARDRARALSPEIREPEMVLPETAHAAFHKAAHYLDVRPVVVPVEPTSFRADVGAMRNAIGPRTILLVGSAVSYAHGVVDPIREIGALALERDLLLHVDGCMGGFLLPYLRRLGEPIPDFDWRVPGVTSISMDFHKYAFAAKGASVVMYRDRELRRHQIYACAGWTGYTVVNPTVQSTKSAGPLAATWAVLHFLGDEGYTRLARAMLDATRRVCAGIERIPGLRILGSPDMNLVAFTSDEVSVFHVADEMRARRWFVQPQLAFGRSKENLHLSINPAAGPWVEEFLADLAASVEAARALPSGVLAGSLHAALEGMDPAAPSEEDFSRLLAFAGIEGDALPARMAAINEMMNALAPPMREALLIEYVNRLYRPVGEVAP
ncbi:MAG TPA: aspartate aminotransferase family protein [Candidatus Binatia bacterium]|nr:aspartate aminotransferase family protein [Candidatus Binatia bacterium]